MTSLKEINEDVLTDVIFSCESKSGMKLYVTSQQSIILAIPHDNMSMYEFLFDTKEDWEDFLEKLWSTQHYMAVRKKDFIEFFQALRYLHGHHCRQMDVVAARQKTIDKEIAEQQENLEKLKKILSHYEDYYEEVYNENKV